MRRYLHLSITAVLALLAGCGGGHAMSADSAVRRACDVQTLRLHGSFQRALGSQFGAVTISVTGQQSCQLRGGRPKVVVYVAGEPIGPPAHGHDPRIQSGDGPRYVTIPTTARDDGPGFRFEWQGTCLPHGPISVRVQLPGSTTRLRVTHSDRIGGPRCDVQGTKGTIMTSLLGRDVRRLAI